MKFKRQKLLKYYVTVNTQPSNLYDYLVLKFAIFRVLNTSSLTLVLGVKKISEILHLI